MLQFGFQLGCLIHIYIVELAVCICSLTCAKLDFHWTFWNCLLHKLESVCTLSLSNQAHAHVCVRERDTLILVIGFYLLYMHWLLLQVLEVPDSSLLKTATGIMTVSSVLLARHLWLDEGSSPTLKTSSALNVPSRSWCEQPLHSEVVTFGWLEETK